MTCRVQQERITPIYSGATPANAYNENRNSPLFPPDPCIKPSQGHMTCRPQYPPCPPNNLCLPAACSSDSRWPGAVYQFDRRYPFAKCATCEEYTSHPCASLGPITDLPCPCTNRCPVFLRPKPYDLSLMYPKCVDRPATPHFETPIYGQPTPYITWSSTNPETRASVQQCRVPFSKHLKCQCPNSAPHVGPNLIMFLHCANY